ncbi:hypothetical protein HDE_13705 [Halotydeus destructor]|nr:hypothetical protein HDE_13705 [Halotydeus destructor]
MSKVLSAALMIIFVKCILSLLLVQLCSVRAQTDAASNLDMDKYLYSKERRGHPWQMSAGSFRTVPYRTYTLENEALPNWSLFNYLLKRDSVPPPPGFVGSRGRRSEAENQREVSDSDQDAYKFMFKKTSAEETLPFREAFFGARG